MEWSKIVACEKSKNYIEMELQISCLLGQNTNSVADLPATFLKVGWDYKYLQRAQSLLFQSLQWVNLIVFLLSLCNCREWLLFSLPGGIFLSFSIKTTKTWISGTVTEEKEIEAKKSKKFEGNWKLTNKCQSRKRWQFANQLRKLIQL